ncbi:uncharacterized protein Pyn_32581 [Prunus yedoensis var. nudiflora]|uniref:Pyrrolo-quinoline quinone repeat domain-containing protein n=1 Tax=Prunus yedoensis var. nudiflora TaxID=2094558 RepID=A0A314UJS3_PRUYE|nr:uncharacterized protein Pyn_32581 [Prunus yedoensis var. nudiflora]
MFDRSNLMADLHAARQFWQFGEYAGAAIWGSSPSIDVPRNLVFIATSNLYSAPPRIIECQEKENNQTVPSHPEACIEPDNHSESIVALDLDTGKIKWYKQLGGYDIWFGACHRHLDPRCPPGPSPDADFGEAPMMLTTYVNGTKKDIVVAVQKSGFAWALDRDTGSWTRRARRRSNVGCSHRRKKGLYKHSQQPAQELHSETIQNSTIAGGWVAMEARNGNIIWSTANSNDATAPAAVTVANGVVSEDPRTGKDLYAMNAKTGKILWSHDTGATVYGGISVSDGCIYLGNGYKVFNGFVNPNYTAGTSLFAFCV